MVLKRKLGEIKSLAQGKVEDLKAGIQDQAETLYDLSKKDYNLSVIVDKKGIKHEVKEERPTRHTIKWKSKGY